MHVYNNACFQYEKGTSINVLQTIFFISPFGLNVCGAFGWILQLE